MGRLVRFGYTTVTCSVGWGARVKGVACVRGQRTRRRGVKGTGREIGAVAADEGEVTL